ncbi:cytochrome P450 [Hyaloscypha variabilis F]|uniref:Cytochrome P450 n=1 Tax=Hyaloscypha variabilis (strain UAMH 11265 / GT02V1 / F) TaxID=1149755 RepID=A0A2J6SBQ5_HYAVF|nr:cytochrome P450 [Hyaloscypha variabilis F]
MATNMGFSIFPTQSLTGFVVVSLVLMIATYFICLIVYRVYFHPLAKYPGPFLAKITDFYSVYHAWKGDRHIDFYLCHEKYGAIVRYGPNRLAFNTSTALHTIHSPKANVEKTSFYAGLRQPVGHNILSVVDKSDHTRKRRAMAHAFSEKALKSYEEDMIRHIRLFCQKLRESEGPVNVANWCSYLTADVLGELCFGKSFGMLESEENRFVMKTMLDSARLAFITGCTLQLKAIPGIQKAFFSSMLSSRIRYRAFVMKQAAARTSIPASQGRKDFYHYLMEAKNPNTDEKWSLPELWAEANNLIVAGSDTSALTLSATFFYLTHNERTLERATSEVREVFKERDVEDVRPGAKLNGCKYLRACIDEAMRLSPSVPGILPRVVMPGGMEIDGQFLKEGVEVGVGTYAIHHNAKYFPEPFEYRPERWLEEGPELDIAQKAFTPFSLGPRGCIGKGMAYMEMMIVMARVLMLFDIKVVGTLGEGSPDLEAGRRRKGDFQVKDCFISLKNGPMIEFKAVA